MTLLNYLIKNDGALNGLIDSKLLIVSAIKPID